MNEENKKIPEGWDKYKKHNPNLKVGDKINFSGHHWPEGEFINGPDVVGEDYFSHSEGRRADMFFCPEGQVWKISNWQKGSARSFATFSLERIQ